jgi:hypothetical protein
MRDVSPLHQYVFMAWCLVKHRDLTFIFSYSGVTEIRDPAYVLPDDYKLISV